jgi:hypothetical protein
MPEVETRLDSNCNEEVSLGLEMLGMFRVG